MNKIFSYIPGFSSLFGIVNEAYKLTREFGNWNDFFIVHHIDQQVYSRILLSLTSVCFCLPTLIKVTES